MAMWKQYIVLFGGFIDAGARTTYLNDLWVFSTEEYKWTEIKQNDLRRPGPRSAFSFLPTADGIVLHGGYCKRYIKGQRTQGVALEDTWFLKMDEKDLTKLDWTKRRKVGYVPNPPRSGCTMALWHAKQMGVLFGGVTDTEADEESLESTFWNALYGYQLQGGGRWISLNLKKRKKMGGQGGKKKREKAAAQAAAKAAEAARRREEAEERAREEAEEAAREDAGDSGDEDSDEDGSESDDGEEHRHHANGHAGTIATDTPPSSIAPDDNLMQEDDDPDDPQKSVPLERYNAMREWPAEISRAIPELSLNCEPISQSRSNETSSTSMAVSLRQGTASIP
jgi:Galactose oxidase, central domain